MPTALSWTKLPRSGPSSSPTTPPFGNWTRPLTKGLEDFAADIAVDSVATRRRSTVALRSAASSGRALMSASAAGNSQRQGSTPDGTEASSPPEAPREANASPSLPAAATLQPSPQGKAVQRRVSRPIVVGNDEGEQETAAAGERVPQAARLARNEHESGDAAIAHATDSSPLPFRKTAPEAGRGSLSSAEELMGSAAAAASALGQALAVRDTGADHSNGSVAAVGKKGGRSRQHSRKSAIAAAYFSPYTSNGPEGKAPSTAGRPNRKGGPKSSDSPPHMALEVSTTASGAAAGPRHARHSLTPAGTSHSSQANATTGAPRKGALKAPPLLAGSAARKPTKAAKAPAASPAPKKESGSARPSTSHSFSTLASAAARGAGSESGVVGDAASMCSSPAADAPLTPASRRALSKPRTRSPNKISSRPTALPGEPAGGARRRGGSGEKVAAEQATSTQGEAEGLSHPLPDDGLEGGEARVPAASSTANENANTPTRKGSRGRLLRPVVLESDDDDHPRASQALLEHRESQHQQQQQQHTQRFAASNTSKDRKRMAVKDLPVIPVAPAAGSRNSGSATVAATPAAQPQRTARTGAASPSLRNVTQLEPIGRHILTVPARHHSSSVHSRPAEGDEGSTCKAAASSSTRQMLPRSGKTFTLTTGPGSAHRLPGGITVLASTLPNGARLPSDTTAPTTRVQPTNSPFSLQLAVGAAVRVSPSPNSQQQEVTHEEVPCSDEPLNCTSSSLTSAMSPGQDELLRTQPRGCSLLASSTPLDDSRLPADGSIAELRRGRSKCTLEEDLRRSARKRHVTPQLTPISPIHSIASSVAGGISPNHPLAATGGRRMGTGSSVDLSASRTPSAVSTGSVLPTNRSSRRGSPLAPAAAHLLPPVTAAPTVTLQSEHTAAATPSTGAPDTGSGAAGNPQQRVKGRQGWEQVALVALDSEPRIGEPVEGVEPKQEAVLAQTLCSRPALVAVCEGRTEKVCVQPAAPVSPQPTATSSLDSSPADTTETADAPLPNPSLGQTADSPAPHQDKSRSGGFPQSPPQPTSLGKFVAGRRHGARQQSVEALSSGSRLAVPRARVSGVTGAPEDVVSPDDTASASSESVCTVPAPATRGHRLDTDATAFERSEDMSRPPTFDVATFPPRRPAHSLDSTAVGGGGSNGSLNAGTRLQRKREKPVEGGAVVVAETASDRGSDLREEFKTPMDAKSSLALKRCSDTGVNAADAVQLPRFYKSSAATAATDGDGDRPPPSLNAALQNATTTAASHQDRTLSAEGKDPFTGESRGDAGKKPDSVLAHTLAPSDAIVRWTEARAMELSDAAHHRLRESESFGRSLTTLDASVAAPAGESGSICQNSLTAARSSHRGSNSATLAPSDIVVVASSSPNLEANQETAVAHRTRAAAAATLSPPAPPPATGATRHEGKHVRTLRPANVASHRLSASVTGNSISVLQTDSFAVDDKSRAAALAADDDANDRRFTLSRPIAQRGSSLTSSTQRMLPDMTSDSASSAVTSSRSGISPPLVASTAVPSVVSSSLVTTLQVPMGAALGAGAEVASAIFSPNANPATHAATVRTPVTPPPPPPPLTTLTRRANEATTRVAFSSAVGADLKRPSPPRGSDAGGAQVTPLGGTVTTSEDRVSTSLPVPSQKAVPGSLPVRVEVSEGRSAVVGSRRGTQRSSLMGVSMDSRSVCSLIEHETSTTKVWMSTTSVTSGNGAAAGRFPGSSKVALASNSDPLTTGAASATPSSAAPAALLSPATLLPQLPRILDRRRSSQSSFTRFSQQSTTDSTQPPTPHAPRSANASSPFVRRRQSSSQQHHTISHSRDADMMFPPSPLVEFTFMDGSVTGTFDDTDGDSSSLGGPGARRRSLVTMAGPSGVYAGSHSAGAASFTSNPLILRRQSDAALLQLAAALRTVAPSASGEEEDAADAPPRKESQRHASTGVPMNMSTHNGSTSDTSAVPSIRRGSVASDAGLAPHRRSSATNGRDVQPKPAAPPQAPSRGVGHEASGSSTSRGESAVTELLRSTSEVHITPGEGGDAKRLSWSDKREQSSSNNDRPKPEETVSSAPSHTNSAADSPSASQPANALLGASPAHRSSASGSGTTRPATAGSCHPLASSPKQPHSRHGSERLHSHEGDSQLSPAVSRTVGSASLAGRGSSLRPTAPRKDSLTGGDIDSLQQPPAASLSSSSPIASPPCSTSTLSGGSSLRTTSGAASTRPLSVPFSTPPLPTALTSPKASIIPPKTAPVVSVSEPVPTLFTNLFAGQGKLMMEQFAAAPSTSAALSNAPRSSRKHAGNATGDVVMAFLAAIGRQTGLAGAVAPAKAAAPGAATTTAPPPSCTRQESSDDGCARHGLLTGAAAAATGASNTVPPAAAAESPTNAVPELGKSTMRPSPTQPLPLPLGVEVASGQVMPVTSPAIAAAFAAAMQQTNAHFVAAATPETERQGTTRALRTGHTAPRDRWVTVATAGERKRLPNVASLPHSALESPPMIPGSQTPPKRQRRVDLSAGLVEVDREPVVGEDVGDDATVAMLECERFTGIRGAKSETEDRGPSVVSGANSSRSQTFNPLGSPMQYPEDGSNNSHPRQRGSLYNERAASRTSLHRANSVANRSTMESTAALLGVSLSRCAGTDTDARPSGAASERASDPGEREGEDEAGDDAAPLTRSLLARCAMREGTFAQPTNSEILTLSTPEVEDVHNRSIDDASLALSHASMRRISHEVSRATQHRGSVAAAALDVVSPVHSEQFSGFNRDFRRGTTTSGLSSVSWDVASATSSILLPSPNVHAKHVNSRCSNVSNPSQQHPRTGSRGGIPHRSSATASVFGSWQSSFQSPRLRSFKNANGSAHGVSGATGSPGSNAPLAVGTAASGEPVRRTVVLLQEPGEELSSGRGAPHPHVTDTATAAATEVHETANTLSGSSGGGSRTSRSGTRTDSGRSSFLPGHVSASVGRNSSDRQPLTAGAEQNTIPAVAPRKSEPRQSVARPVSPSSACSEHVNGILVTNAREATPTMGAASAGDGHKAKAVSPIIGPAGVSTEVQVDDHLSPPLSSSHSRRGHNEVSFTPAAARHACAGPTVTGPPSLLRPQVAPLSSPTRQTGPSFPLSSFWSGHGKSLPVSLGSNDETDREEDKHRSDGHVDARSQGSLHHAAGEEDGELFAASATSTASGALNSPLLSAASTLILPSHVPEGNHAIPPYLLHGYQHMRTTSHHHLGAAHGSSVTTAVPFSSLTANASQPDATADDGSGAAVDDVAGADNTPPLPAALVLSPGQQQANLMPVYTSAMDRNQQQQQQHSPSGEVTHASPLQTRSPDQENVACSRLLLQETLLSPSAPHHLRMASAYEASLATQLSMNVGAVFTNVFGTGAGASASESNSQSHGFLSPASGVSSAGSVALGNVVDNDEMSTMLVSSLLYVPREMRLYPDFADFVVTRSWNRENSDGSAGAASAQDQRGSDPTLDSVVMVMDGRPVRVFLPAATATAATPPRGDAASPQFVSVVPPTHIPAERHRSASESGANGSLSDYCRASGTAPTTAPFGSTLSAAGSQSSGNATSSRSRGQSSLLAGGTYDLSSLGAAGNLFHPFQPVVHGSRAYSLYSVANTLSNQDASSNGGDRSLTSVDGDAASLMGSPYLSPSLAGQGHGTSFSESTSLSGAAGATPANPPLGSHRLSTEGSGSRGGIGANVVFTNGNNDIAAAAAGACSPRRLSQQRQSTTEYPPLPLSSGGQGVHARKSFADHPQSAEGTADKLMSPPRALRQDRLDDSLSVSPTASTGKTVATRTPASASSGNQRPAVASPHRQQQSTAADTASTCDEPGGSSVSRYGRQGGLELSNSTTTDASASERASSPESRPSKTPQAALSCGILTGGAAVPVQQGPPTALKTASPSSAGPPADSPQQPQVPGSQGSHSSVSEEPHSLLNREGGESSLVPSKTAGEGSSGSQGIGAMQPQVIDFLDFSASQMPASTLSTSVSHVGSIDGSYRAHHLTPSVGISSRASSSVEPSGGRAQTPQQSVPRPPPLLPGRGIVATTITSPNVSSSSRGTEERVGSSGNSMGGTHNAFPTYNVRGVKGRSGTGTDLSGTGRSSSTGDNGGASPSDEELLTVGSAVNPFLNLAKHQSPEAHTLLHHPQPPLGGKRETKEPAHARRIAAQQQPKQGGARATRGKEEPAAATGSVFRSVLGTPDMSPPDTESRAPRTGFTSQSSRLQPLLNRRSPAGVFPYAQQTEAPASHGVAARAPKPPPPSTTKLDAATTTTLAPAEKKNALRQRSKTKRSKDRGVDAGDDASFFLNLARQSSRSAVHFCGRNGGTTRCRSAHDWNASMSMCMAGAGFAGGFVGFQPQASATDFLLPDCPMLTSVASLQTTMDDVTAFTDRDSPAAAREPASDDTATFPQTQSTGVGRAPVASPPLPSPPPRATSGQSRCTPSQNVPFAATTSSIPTPPRKNSDTIAPISPHKIEPATGAMPRTSSSTLPSRKYSLPAALGGGPLRTFRPNSLASHLDDGKSTTQTFTEHPSTESCEDATELMDEAVKQQGEVFAVAQPPAPPAAHSSQVRGIAGAGSRVLDRKSTTEFKHHEQPESSAEAASARRSSLKPVGEAPPRMANSQAEDAQRNHAEAQAAMDSAATPHHVQPSPKPRKTEAAVERSSPSPTSSPSSLSYSLTGFVPVTTNPFPSVGNRSGQQSREDSWQLDHIGSKAAAPEADVLPSSFSDSIGTSSAGKGAGTREDSAETPTAVGTDPFPSGRPLVTGNGTHRAAPQLQEEQMQEGHQQQLHRRNRGGVKDPGGNTGKGSAAARTGAGWGSSSSSLAKSSRKMPFHGISPSSPAAGGNRHPGYGDILGLGQPFLLSPSISSLSTLSLPTSHTATSVCHSARASAFSGPRANRAPSVSPSPVETRGVGPKARPVPPLSSRTTHHATTASSRLPPAPSNMFTKVNKTPATKTARDESRQ